MTVKRETRAKAFAAIRAARQKPGPTLFNPYFAIRGTPSADPLLTSRLGNGKERGTKGPAMKTTQWEATAKRCK